MGQTCMELLFWLAASHLVGFAAMRNFISEVQSHSSLSLSKSELPWSVLVFLQLSRRLVQGALQPRIKLELNARKSCLFSTNLKELMYLKMNHFFIQWVLNLLPDLMLVCWYIWWEGKGRKAGLGICVLRHGQCPWFHLFVSWSMWLMWLFVFTVGLKIIVRWWKRPVLYGNMQGQYSVDHSGLSDYWMTACVCRDWLSDPDGLFQSYIFSCTLAKSTLVLKLLRTKFS